MNLIELHDKHGAGKGKVLMSRYEELFYDLKYKEIELLELGIHKGGSLRMWRDYFSKGQIAGIDRNNNWMILNELRISTTCMNQVDIPIIFKNPSSQFNIIIDDCSHIGNLTRKSFRHLFGNHLKPGGIYVIEDWNLPGMIEFVKELIDELAIEKKIDRVIYFEGIVFVYKK